MHLIAKDTFLPNMQYHTDKLNDAVEEDDIEYSARDKRQSCGVYNFISPFFCLVQCAYVFLSSQVCNDKNDEGDKSRDAKQPFIFTIECVGNFPSDTDRYNTQRHQEYRGETT